MKTAVGEINRVTRLYLKGAPLGESEVYGAISHVRYVEREKGKERASKWYRFYSARFAKSGVTLPPVEDDIRSWRMRALFTRSASFRSKLGRPSSRPAYCTRPDRKTCRKCPLCVFRGFDCHGMHIGRSGWGAPVGLRISLETSGIALDKDSLRIKAKEGQRGRAPASYRQKVPATCPRSGSAQ